jgi:hypothetical protein
MRLHGHRLHSDCGGAPVDERLSSPAARCTLTKWVLHERLAGGGQLGAQVGAGAHAAAPAVQQQIVRDSCLGLVPTPQRVQQRPTLKAQPLHLHI